MRGARTAARAVHVALVPTRFIAHANHVLKGRRPIKVSSGTIYSHYFRAVVSMATIDVEAVVAG